MMYKTVTVTNPRNVLVQIPSLIAGIEWGLDKGDELEVLYSDETKEVTIRPVLLGRGDFVNKG
jgi:hypothetical protein